MPSIHKKSFAAEQLALRQKKKVSPVVWVLVGVVVVVLTIGGYVLYIRMAEQDQVENKAQRIRSVAVLPFENLSDTQEDVYFSDGVTDDIIFRLQQIKALKVISRTSSVLYRSSNKSIPEIGKELDVASILEGTVRRAGNRVKITIQLIDSQSDSHLWGNQYEQNIDNIFTIQEEIAQAVVDQLKITLLGEEKTRMVTHHTENIEAYDLYLLGCHYMYNSSIYNIFRTIDYFLQAIKKDQKFALAYSGIADIYSFAGMVYTPKFPLIAKAVAEKALELNSSLAEPYVSLAQISIYNDYDWTRAESLCKRAIELNPGYDVAHYVYHTLLLITGRTQEALSEIKKAQELNPQFTRWIYLTMDVYGILGRYDEAMEEYNKYNAIDPDGGNYYLGRLYMCQGKYEKAIEVIEKIDKEHFYLAYLYAMTGNHDRAQKIFDTYIEQQRKTFESTNIDKRLTELKIRELAPYISSIDIERTINEIKEQADEMKETFINKRMIWIYTAMGENDKAFECLEELYQKRGTRMLGVTWEPEMYPLHSDPRWSEFMKKLGLPINK